MPLQVGFFYWTLADLGPAYSGKDWSIWLSMLVYDDCLSNKDYKQRILSESDASFATGLNKFNKPEGCVIQTARGERKVQAQLFTVIADTPAAGYLSSRNISVGSARCPCRHCDGQMCKEDRLGGPGFLNPSHAVHLPGNSSADRNTLLTKQEEQKQRSKYAAANATKKRSLETELGIKGSYTFFEAVHGFNIINRVPHDPMHVFLEGILKFELYLALHWMAKGLGMTVGTVNTMITKHKYLQEEKHDLPAKIADCHLEGRSPKTDGKIKQTAGMVITLARNFASIFGSSALSLPFSPSLFMCRG